MSKELHLFTKWEDTMIRAFIEKMYRRGQHDEARRAIRAEIIREYTDEGEEPVYEPTEAEIDSAEGEYYAARRQYEYGSPEAQMEYITENGLAAWQERVAEIKDGIPKS